MSLMDVAGPAIRRIDRDARLLFAPDALGALCPGIPAPKVTLDLPGGEPEGLHVFTWGTAREFSSEDTLTNGTVAVTFHVWMTVVAMASEAIRASEVASAYQATALQIALNDYDLGGAVNECRAPTIREADAWADSDGRRHAGYLLDFELVKYIQPSDEVLAIIEGSTDE